MTAKSTITAILLIASASASLAADVPFSDVLKNYAALQGRRVTLVGLAEVAGADFYLWNLQDRHHKDSKRAISVLWDMRVPNYPAGSNVSHYTYLNLRRVRITGTVDIRFHGRWGDIPFGIDLERVEVLPGDRERRFLTDIGVFHNSMSSMVEVRLYSRRGSIYAYITGIAPNEYSDTAIEEGSATLARRSSDTEVSVRPKKVISTCKISSTASSRRYYDSRQHVYYYDISDGKIKLVMPREAQKWKLLPMVERN